MIDAPRFRVIGVEEWSRTHFKHGCHHLMQFGLIEVDFATQERRIRPSAWRYAQIIRRNEL